MEYEKIDDTSFKSVVTKTEEKVYNVKDIKIQIANLENSIVVCQSKIMDLINLLKEAEKLKLDTDIEISDSDIDII